MCAGAIVLGARDARRFGAWDPKAGMAGSVGDLLRHPRLNHGPRSRAVCCEDECGALLREFFATAARCHPERSRGLHALR